MDKAKRRGGRVSAVMAAAAFAFASSAFGLDVGGSISATTTWSAANSPYRVTADVTVDGGATLIVEPGVTVYMEPGTNLTVNAGALRAQGTTALPIVFTASSDTGAGSPAPGSWGALRFRNGTNDAFTVLDNVELRYGQGMVIESASPTLNRVKFINNSGPAISLDLNSSPAGVGLQASGNGVNGIVVPAGEITSSVLWGLQGIPYVVAQGLVSIGRAPVINSVSPNEIAQGQTMTMTVDGLRLAGVESVRFDNTALTTVLNAGGSDTSFTINVTAPAQAPTGATGLDVQVAAGKVRLNNAITVIPPKPPITITNVSPNLIHRTESLQVVVTGTQLNGAQIATLPSGLTVTGYTTTATEARFTLAASATATLGAQQIVFTNAAIASGSASASITVLDAPPKPSVSPAPLAVPPDGAPRSFSVRLSAADAVSNSFTLTVTDTTVATVTPASVTIPAGQTQVIATIRGLKLGQTVLTLNSPTLGTLTIPIFISNESAGLNTANAPNLGVVLQAPAAPPVQTSIPVTAVPLGVAVGNYISGISPPVLTVGTGPVPLVITGGGLGAVTSVSLFPATGITLGTPSASADGTTLTIPATIAADAPATMRQVIVSAGSTRYIATRPSADRVKVVFPPPVVDSIIPLYGTPGTTGLAFTITGRHFQDLQSIAFSPADGITLTPASVNAGGSQITFSVNIAANAPLGPRLVLVTTLGGSSSSEAAPANTFTVVNQIQQTFAPFVAPVVGVVLQPAEAPPLTQNIPLTASLGVALGGAVSGITPAVGTVGETLTLTVLGNELNGITAIQFAPATGVTVGAPQIAADGKSATVSVTIASNAPPTLRTVQVFAGAQRLTFALPSAALFRVTPPQPRVDSINPLYLQVGAALSTLTIGGVNFQNASQVRVLPSDGMTIGSPTVNADGTGVTVTIQAAANAALGARVVTVVTPAGETTSTANAANTLTLTSPTSSSTSYGPFATVLGIVVQSPPAPPTPTAFGPFTAPAVGVLIPTPPPAPTNVAQFAAAPPIGILLAPYAQARTPAGVLVGQTTTLTVDGANLNAVTSVSFSPSDGLSLTGPFSVNADGTQLTVTVAADAAARSGYRQLVLTTASGSVQFIDPRARHFTVVPAIPSVDSIDPILATQGAAFTLTIRGSNMQYATGVTITPATGVSFGAMTINAAGTQLTVPMSIAPDAPTGARVIQIVTPAGSTTADATPANTFTVLSP